MGFVVKIYHTQEGNSAGVATRRCNPRAGGLQGGSRMAKSHICACEVHLKAHFEVHFRFTFIFTTFRLSESVSSWICQSRLPPPLPGHLRLSSCVSVPLRQFPMSPSVAPFVSGRLSVWRWARHLSRVLSHHRSGQCGTPCSWWETGGGGGAQKLQPPGSSRRRAGS